MKNTEIMPGKEQVPMGMLMPLKVLLTYTEGKQFHRLNNGLTVK